jgi:hypothetical protein
MASPAGVLSTNALAGLHWLTVLRGDFDPQRFPGALANPNCTGAEKVNYGLLQTNMTPAEMYLLLKLGPSKKSPPSGRHFRETVERVNTVKGGF